MSPLGKSYWFQKLLFVLACTLISIAIAQDGNNRKPEDLDQFVYLGPVFIKDKHSLSEFRALGKVLSEQYKEEGDPYNPKKKNEFVELVFDGLLIYGRLEKGTLQIIRIKITGEKWEVLNGLNVGASAKKIAKKLGIPTKQSAGSKEYCGETECVFFYVKGNRISGVEFSYYAD